MPVTICAAMRVGSKTIPRGVEKLQSDQAYAETSVKSAEPTETSRCVRRPASRSRISRSMPIAPPSTAATSEPEQSVERREPGHERPLLRLGDAFDPEAAKLEQVVEQLARERRALGRRLHLHEPAVAGHHDVHVHLGGRVLGVLEVEQRLAVDDPDRDRGDRVGERAREPEAVERAARRDVRARDRRAARAAVGLEHVAVELDRALAERLEVEDARSARPISRWISTVRPPGWPRETSRSTRSPVDAGSSEYSAVIQPRPELRSQRGTPSSIVAVQSTFVLPCDQSTAPCGCSR